MLSAAISVPFPCPGLRQTLLPRWDFILDYDNQKSVEEAIALLEQEVRST